MIKISVNTNKIAVEFKSIQENPTPGTWGSHQLLRQYYRELDDDLDPKSYAGRWRMYKFTLGFVKKIEKKYGELHCEYCGKPDLKIYLWGEKQKKDVATSDHFLPQSKYPNLIFAEGNLRVCCQNCNKKKGNKVYKDDTLKFEYPEMNRVRLSSNKI